jgi:hypothetical protein
MTGKLSTLAGTLVIPLAMLLFAQWPLRDGLGAFSRQANDMAQILFALYAAVAVSAASYANAHLALAKLETVASKSIVKWRAWAWLACVGPWSLLVLWSAVPQTLASVLAMERFSEGLTAGYFVLRIALVMLALLVLLHALRQVLPQRLSASEPGP